MSSTSPCDVADDAAKIQKGGHLGWAAPTTFYSSGRVNQSSMAVLAFLCLLAGMARAVAADDGFSAFDDVPAAPAEPTVPAAAVEGARRGLRSDCADSASWYYNDDPDKTCEAYVSKKSKNCKKKDEFKVGRSALARRQKLVTVAHRRSRAKTPAR